MFSLLSHMVVDYAVLLPYSSRLLSFLFISVHIVSTCVRMAFLLYSRVSSQTLKNLPVGNLAWVKLPINMQWCVSVCVCIVLCSKYVFVSPHPGPGIGSGSSANPKRIKCLVNMYVRVRNIVCPFLLLYILFVAVDWTPILTLQCVRQEYTLDGMPVYHKALYKL